MFRNGGNRLDFIDFDLADLSAAQSYKLLSGAVLPRPIALITTRSAAGIANAAPFSFFGVLSHDPATLAVGIEPRPDGSRKDTAQNIRDTGVFIVHIPDAAMAEQVQALAAPDAPEVDEIALNGLATLPGRHVDCPRLADAPVALECEFRQSIDLGPARDVILGTVRGITLRADIVNDRHHVDPGKLDALGRLGGAVFATTRDRFTL